MPRAALQPNTVEFTEEESAQNQRKFPDCRHTLQHTQGVAIARRITANTHFWVGKRRRRPSRHR